MIDDKKAGALRVEAGRAPHNEMDARELHHHAAKHALSAVIPAGIDEDAEQNEEAAHGKEKRRGEKPMIRAPRNGPSAAKPLLAAGLCRCRRRNRLFAFHVHTITSSAPGSTSSDSASSVSTSPSTTTSTGFFNSNSIRAAVRLEAIRCRICEPVKSVGRFRTRPKRPIGPQ